MAEAIGRRIAKGISWSAAGQIGTELLRVAAGFVLARFVSPAEFGLVAMVTVIANYANVVLNFGFGSALVQKKAVDEDDLSTVFWLNFAMGLAFTALLAAASPVVAWMYGAPELEPLTVAMALNFLVLALGFVQRRLLERELLFERLAKIELVAAVLSSAAAIAAAVAGAGAWSLVTWTLARAFVVTVGTWASSSWRPTLRFSVPALREMWSFAANVFVSETLNYFGTNVDRFLVGQALGASALGLYDQATRLVLMPVANVSMVLARVLMPAFSRIQDEPDKIAAIYLRGTRAALFLASPALVGLAAAGARFVPLAYGPGWEGLPDILAITAITGVAATQLAFQNSVYRAVGQAGLELRLGVVRRVSSLACVLAGLAWGVTGAALGRLVATGGSIVLMVLAISWVLPAPPRAQWTNVRATAISVACMYVAVRAVDAFLPGGSDAAALAVDVLVGVAVFGALSLAQRDPSLVEVRALLARRLS